MNLTPTRKPLTFRRALLSGFSTAFLLVSLGTAAVVLPGLQYDGPTVTPYSEGEDNLGRPYAEGSPAAVMAEHGNDCWTGEAPADVEFPGHVVWQHPGGRTVYSAHLVGPALDTLFADGDLAGEAIAFCR